MARPRRGDTLVDNQKAVLVALASARARGVRQVWLGDIKAELSEVTEEPMHDTTINRALKEFASRNWVSASWRPEDPDDHASSRPRLYFELSRAGYSAAQQLVDRERSALPRWILEPELFGLEPRVAVGAGHRKRTPVRAPLHAVKRTGS